MAMDFPASPANGATYTPAGGPTYVFNNGVWLQSSAPLATRTARTRNRVINPNCAISQENGTTPGTVNGYYMADQWLMSPTGIVSQGALSSGGFVSPNGSTTGVYVQATTAKASLAATDYLGIFQYFEGVDTSDFLWGTASAIPAVLRFNAYADTPGTYGVSVVSGNSDRSWCGSFTCTTSFQTFVFPIPPTTTGTFTNNNTKSFLLRFAHAFGTTFQGVAGWQNGNFLGPAGCINGAAVAVKNLVVTDVGLYADPEGTGLPPPWSLPNVSEEYYKCRRHYYKSTGNQTCWGRNGTDTYRFANFRWPSYMRTGPTLSATGVLNYAGGQITMVCSATGGDQFEAYYDTAAQNSSFVCQFTVMNARMA